MYWCPSERSSYGIWKILRIHHPFPYQKKITILKELHGIIQDPLIVKAWVVQRPRTTIQDMVHKYTHLKTAEEFRLQQALAMCLQLLPIQYLKNTMKLKHQRNWSESTVLAYQFCLTNLQGSVTLLRTYDEYGDVRSQGIASYISCIPRVSTVFRTIGTLIGLVFEFSISRVNYDVSLKSPLEYQNIEYSSLAFS